MPNLFQIDCHWAFQTTLSHIRVHLLLWTGDSYFIKWKKKLYFMIFDISLIQLCFLAGLCPKERKEEKRGKNQASLPRQEFGLHWLIPCVSGTYLTCRIWLLAVFSCQFGGKHNSSIYIGAYFSKDAKISSLETLFSGIIWYGYITLRFKTRKEGTTSAVTGVDVWSRLCYWFINKKFDSEELSLVWPSTYCWVIVQAACGVKKGETSQGKCKIT